MRINSKEAKFADSTTLFGLVKSSRDCEALQNDLQTGQMVGEMAISFNISSKCKVMHMGNRNLNTYMLMDYELAVTEQERSWDAGRQLNENVNLVGSSSEEGQFHTRDRD